MLELFLQHEQGTHVADRRTLSDRDAIAVPLQSEETGVDTGLARLEQHFDLPEQEEAMGGDENLDAAQAEVDDAAGDGLDDVRIQVRFGLVPVEVSLVEQDPGSDQAGEHPQLAEAFGDQRHLHLAAGVPQIEPAVFIQLDRAFHGGFQRIEQLADPFLLGTFLEQGAEQQAGVAPGPSSSR